VAANFKAFCGWSGVSNETAFHPMADHPVLLQLFHHGRQQKATVHVANAGKVCYLEGKETLRLSAHLFEQNLSRLSTQYEVLLQRSSPWSRL